MGILWVRMCVLFLQSLFSQSLMWEWYVSRRLGDVRPTESTWGLETGVHKGCFQRGCWLRLGWPTKTKNNTRISGVLFWCHKFVILKNNTVSESVKHLLLQASVASPELFYSVESMKIQGWHQGQNLGTQEAGQFGATIFFRGNYWPRDPSLMLPLLQLRVLQMTLLWYFEHSHISACWSLSSFINKTFFKFVSLAAFQDKVLNKHSTQHVSTQCVWRE